MSKLPLEIRKIIVQEINHWEARGILTQMQASVVRHEYDFDFPPAVQPGETSAPAGVPPAQNAAPQAGAVPPKPQATLMQTLLSEASIKIALYLGAFFVIGAALIFAALVEMLRLPILLIVAVLFLGGALALKKRLPQPSFTLFVVFTVLVPINASVFIELLDLTGKAATTYWILVAGGMSLLWGFSIWFYHSRFFSLLSYAALAAAAGLAGSLVDEPSTELYLIVLGAACICAIPGAWILKRWQGQDFALPLFIVAQAMQFMLLLIAFLYALSAPLFSSSSMNWLGIALVWLLAALFYVLSDIVVASQIFPFLAAGSLLLLPWLVLGAFKPQNDIYAFGWWAWGALFAVSGEILGLIKLPRLRQYSLPFSLGALALLGTGALVGWVNGIALGFSLFLGAAVLLAVVHAFSARWWVWSTALLFGLFAYFLFFYLPAFEAPQGYPVYQFLGAILLLLLPDLFLKADLDANREWRWPLRTYGLPLLIPGTVITLVAGANNPQQAVICFAALACFFLIYALRYGQSTTWQAGSGFLFTGFLALATLFATRLYVTDQWSWPLIGLATIYYMSGFVLTELRKGGGWQNVLRFSGLGLATLTAFSTPLEHMGLAASIVIGIAATLWAGEALQRWNVWLGFPANGLYLMAYFNILIELEVSQPQFFSVGAAMLGILMHYLLLRSGSKAGAFFTGLLSQFVLLGTTYIQMAWTRDLTFFVALFLQSLVVLVYGIVIRSRSLTFTPIGWVVLGVITVAFTVLQDISTVILVGCTGMLMILLGILAVVMRQSITSMGDYMSDWNA